MTASNDELRELLHRAEFGDASESGWGRDVSPYTAKLLKELVKVVCEIRGTDRTYSRFDFVEICPLYPIMGGCNEDRPTCSHMEEAAPAALVLCPRCSKEFETDLQTQEGLYLGRGWTLRRECPYCGAQEKDE